SKGAAPDSARKSVLRSAAPARPAIDSAAWTGASACSAKEMPMATVKPIPDGYPQVIPYLSVDGASSAIDFYTKVFGAKERMRLAAPEGKIGHAELQIGDSVVMLADVFPEMGGQSPKSIGGTPVSVMVYVEDVDAVFGRALSAGA